MIGPFLAAWKAQHPSVSGHQGRYDLREIVNAIFYQNRTGCQWAYRPHDLPPKSATEPDRELVPPPASNHRDSVAVVTMASGSGR